MSAPHPADRPLPLDDPFNTALRQVLGIITPSERPNPAENTKPPGNPPLDKRAVARVAKMLHTIVG
jgi:hypothetical protein